ncbi:CCA tRNA nucleotidyltransferase [Patescibacteria group bacterium]|nr:CCA tRNA nucleotidyltransferase [Patescibacteria group bacterium]MBU1870846.1 CCA tRNA nucleotidyltransferase [Patescibacteria group bacterium]
MHIPDYIKNIAEKLENAGFEVFIVGGCVRDLLMDLEPKDWDITTNARPEQVLTVFSNSKYTNIFGVVLLPLKNNKEEVEQIIEITTYRSEQDYNDRRHPDLIKFEDSLDKDLERRDFTINAMALGRLRITNYELQINENEIIIDNEKYVLIDLFGGKKDLKKKIIRAVGEPIDRFKEDALRMMRAVRLACQLNFIIELKTQRAMIKMANGIKYIANERIRDELIKILISNKAYDGIIMLNELKLLQYIIPELEYGINVDQNRHHIYTVFEHSVLSLKNTPNQDWRVRLASLLHDIAKPCTKKIINNNITFYNHDIIGARIAKKIMQRLKFGNNDIEKVVTLIKNHMFYYNVGEVTEASVRRLIRNVGEENLANLIDLRVADRLGSGVPKAKPYKLRHLEYMMKKVRHDPISVKMLKINGNDLMILLKIKAGPKIGAILDVLLSEVIEDPELNNKKYLDKHSLKLNKLDLHELRQQAKEKIEEKKIEDDQEIKNQFWV